MHTLIPQPNADDGPSLSARGPTPSHSLAIKKGTRDYLRLADDAVIHGRKILIEGHLLPTRMRTVPCASASSSPTLLLRPDAALLRLYRRPRQGTSGAGADGSAVDLQRTLHVGDVFEHGYWTALYTLDCTGVAPAMLSQKSRFR